MLASKFMISCMKEENSKDHYTAYYYLSPSNNELIFIRDDYCLEIRAVGTGKEVFSKNIGKIIRYPTLNSTGKEIMFIESSDLYDNERTLKILDRRTGKEIFSKKIKASDNPPSFSSSGEEIMFMNGDSNLTILNRRTGKEIFSKKFEGWIGSMCFSPFSEEIMLIENQRRLIILNQKTGEEIFSKKFKELIFSPCFNLSDESIEYISLKKGDKMVIIDKKTRKEKKQSLFKLTRDKMGI